MKTYADNSMSITAIEAINLFIRLAELNIPSHDDAGISEVEYDIERGVFRMAINRAFGPRECAEWDPWEPWTADGAKFDLEFPTDSDRLFEEIRRNSWRHLTKTLSRGILTGEYLTMARLRTPLAPLSSLDTDQWRQLKITDWSTGNGEFDNRERAFSLHAANAARLNDHATTSRELQEPKSESQTEPPSRGRAWRTSIAESTARKLWPDGELPRATRKDQIRALRQAVGPEEARMSDTLIMAAIRKMEGRSISPDSTISAD